MDDIPPEGEEAANFLFILLIVITVLYFLFNIYKGVSYGAGASW